MTFLTIAVLVAMVVLHATVIVVPMREVCIVERLGKFQKVLEPGLHFLIPFFDRVSYRHDTREMVLDIPSQSCISRDNIQIEVDGLVYMKVMDPRDASYGIEDYRIAAVNLAQTTMRSEVGKLGLAEMFSEREKLNEMIVKEIDRASDSWGIKVLRYEIMNIKPSDHVVHTLEKQMEAERSKRAEITLATAEKESRIKLSEGERQKQINLSEGEKTRRINESIGRAKEIAIVAAATAEGMELVANAIAHEGGEKAVKLQLVETFIDELSTIMNGADISIMPKEMARVTGVFEGLDQVTQNLKK